MWSWEQLMDKVGEVRDMARFPDLGLGWYPVSSFLLDF
jgi:hypothetical protein